MNIKDLTDRMNAQKLDYIELDETTCLVADMDGIYYVNSESDKRGDRICDSWMQDQQKNYPRKVSEHINDAGTKKAIVYRDDDEYVVKFYVMGHGGHWVILADADYFTDDKADAVATAIYEVSKV